MTSVATASTPEGRQNSPDDRTVIGHMIEGRTVWIFTSNALGSVMGSAAATAGLRRGVIFELLGHGPRATVPGLDVVPTQEFTSASTLASAVSGGGLMPGVKAVLYDPENWQFTPISERLSVEAATAMAAETAHAHGLFLIVTPAMNLTRVLAPKSMERFERGDGEAKHWTRFAGRPTTLLTKLQWRRRSQEGANGT